MNFDDVPNTEFTPKGSFFQKWVLGRSDIKIHGDEYMRRWRFFWFLAKKTGGYRIHNILRSDVDRELHDHPFSYLSFIIKGGYWEHTQSFIVDHSNGLGKPQGIIQWGPNGPLTERRWYGPGSLIYRRATDLHRLELPEGQDAWTFVIAGPARRQWGFMTENGWVPEDKFVTKVGQNHVMHRSHNGRSVVLQGQR